MRSQCPPARSRRRVDVHRDFGCVLSPLMLCLSAMVLLPSAAGQGLRAGSISWTLKGDGEVAFTFTAMVQRSFGGFSGSGSGPGGRVMVGDVVELKGAQPIVFNPGMVGTSPKRIELQVTFVDPEEDVLQGIWRTSIDYGNQSSHAAFTATVDGCCRPLSTGYEPVASSPTLSAGGGSRFTFSTLVTFDGVPHSGALTTVPLLRMYPGRNSTIAAQHPEIVPWTNCSSAIATACATNLKCAGGNVAYTPPLDGLDCTPLVRSCLAPLCMETPPPPRPPPGRFYSPPELGGLNYTTRVFVRGAYIQGGTPSTDVCRRAYHPNGDAGCRLVKGCCSVPGGCEACVTVSSRGVVSLHEGAQQGAYPLTVALSRLPSPKPGCVDHPPTWRGPFGTCEQTASLSRCGDARLGAAEGLAGSPGGVNASFACCACGGGSDQGHVDELQGRDGVYESGCVVGNSSEYGLPVGGANFSAETYHKGTLKISYLTMEASLTLSVTVPNNTDPTTYGCEGGGGGANAKSFMSVTARGQLTATGFDVVDVTVVAHTDVAALYADSVCPLPNGTWGVETGSHVHAISGCGIRSLFGVEQSSIVLHYNGTGGYSSNYRCASELAAAPKSSQRRACGWEGITPDQCATIGCCYSASPSFTPPCYRLTYRSTTNASFGFPGLSPNASADAVDHFVRTMDFPSSPPPLDPPPAALTTTETTVYVLPSMAEEPPELEFLIKDPVGNAGFAAFTGFESAYTLEAGAWRVQGGGRGASVQASVSGDGPRGHTSALSWRYLPTNPGDEGLGVACFQGTLYAGCQDLSLPGKFVDSEGKNCSTLVEDGNCTGNASYILGEADKAVLGRAPQSSFVGAGGLTSAGTDTRLRAGDECCACGGGNQELVYTDVVCYEVSVAPDPPPKIMIAPQVLRMDPPCTTYNLQGKDQVKCTTPVLQPPCRPPFHCGPGEPVVDVVGSQVLGDITSVVIRGGGRGCVEGGELVGRAVEGFGGGFRARFQVSALGHGGTGTITSVDIISGGSGYFKPPHIVILEGGRGCEGEIFEAVLGDSLYHPIIAYPGVGLDLEMIAVDQPFDTITRFALTGDVPAFMSTSTLSPPVQSSSPRGVVSRTLRWDPPRDLSGSWPLVVCFSTEDLSGQVLESGTRLPGKTDEACVMITVARCQYAIKGGETLKHVAAYYGTNWIQVWAANHLLKNPDGADLVEGQLVNVGHTYTVGPGDEMQQIARKFGMTTDAIFSMNYDVSGTPPELLGAGQKLCIIPNSCATNM